jgi:hypothetical protein
MRVLVCGGRDYADAAKVKQVLDWELLEGAPNVIIEGCARGADSLAEAYGAGMNIPVEHYPADWNKHGKAAGPIRNRQMLDEGKPDLVVAFPGERGTENMIEQARRAGVPVRVIDDDRRVRV